MIGIDVYTVDNKHVGVLDDVLQYAANDVYVIKGEDNKRISYTSCYEICT
ncbi:PRC-barrel domain-containing protein [Paraclostridium bifermentans]|nr:PRC-barrel domain-containing protein [Paraclostridium bifermentans]